MSADTPPTGRDLTPALAEFAKLLKHRLERSVVTNEDTVRYTFYYALIKGLRLKPDDITVEPKHEKIGGARLDLRIIKFSGLEYSFEFKYENHYLLGEENKSGQLPARMLGDIFRLARLHEGGKELQCETLFIYLTARWGKNYFRNSKNTLTEVFDLPIGNTLLMDEDYLNQRPHIQKKRIGDIIPCRIQGLYSCCLPDRHALRVYRVDRSDMGAAES
jgi:hypothetical protein